MIWLVPTALLALLPWLFIGKPAWMTRAVWMALTIIWIVAAWMVFSLMTFQENPADGPPMSMAGTGAMAGIVVIIAAVFSLSVWISAIFARRYNQKSHKTTGSTHEHS